MFALICVSIFIDAILYGIIIPILPAFAVTHGLSEELTCFVFAVYPVTMFILALPIGILSDYCGRRPLIIMGMLLMALSTLLFAHAETPTLFMVSRALQGLAAAITWTASLAWICDTYPADKRGAKIGSAGIASGLGLMLGPLMGGSLSQWYGNVVPFYLCAAFTLCVTIGFLWVDSVPSKHLLKKSSIPWGNRNLILACCTVGLAITGLGLYEPLLPLYLTERFSSDKMTIGILFGVISLAYLVSQPVFGWLSDIYGRKRFVVFGFFLTAFASWSFTQISSLTGIFVAGSAMGIGVGLLVTPAIALISDVFSNSNGSHGIAAGFYNLSLSAGLAIGPLVAGLTYETVGYFGLFTIYAACMLLAGIAFAIGYKPGKANN